MAEHVHEERFVFSWYLSEDSSQFASALLKCGFLSIPLSGRLSILLLLHKAEEIGSFWLAQLPCVISRYMLLKLKVRPVF